MRYNREVGKIRENNQIITIVFMNEDDSILPLFILGYQFDA